MGTKVDVELTGAPKSGSTSLHRMLTTSQYFNYSPKEIHFFSNNKWYQHILGKALFLCHYPLFFNKGTRLNLDVGFNMYHPEFVERILDHNPKMKVIILLRNPSSRFISDWRMIHHFHLMGNPQGSSLSLTEKFLADLKELASTTPNSAYNNILRRGIYFPHVKRIVEKMNQSNVLFLKQENLHSNNSETLSLIADFLGIANLNVEEVRINIGDARRIKINEAEEAEIRSELDKFYEPYNQALSGIVPFFNY